MEKSTKLSIVTAYYNRKNLFLETLDSIEKSRHRFEIELIVVDDASDEEHRLENIIDNYSFPIKLIRQEQKDKWYCNPCIPYNMGFREVSSDLVLIQNPECYHVGDVIDYALQHTDDDNYVAFAAYALDEAQTNELATGISPSYSNEISNEGNVRGWYNHSVLNPRPLHFASCITKKNLDELGGFDAAYAEGIGFDDDEFLYRIKDKGLRVDISDTPFVFHQCHYKEDSFEKQAQQDQGKLYKNHALYFEHTLRNYKPKIVGFSQLHNELKLGNLENWFKCMEVCDEIYIFDQNSTDGSKEFYKKFDNVHVIESPTNRFDEELICKAELLEKLLKEQPDTDWIFWLDGDTLLDQRLLNDDGKDLRSVLVQTEYHNIEGIFLGHYNLWRSDVWHRVDDQYDHFMQAGRMAFWKNNGKLSFSKESGLHKSQHPLGLERGCRINYNLIHRGFATDEQILNKYDSYKGRGQSGWALDRLLNESTLQVERVPYPELPVWLESQDEQNPKEKKKIVEIYNE